MAELSKQTIIEIVSR